MRRSHLAALALLLSTTVWLTPARAADEADQEISPIEYSALLGLREIIPEKFKKTLLPLITSAMSDGKITRQELAGIEHAAGPVGPAFLKIATAPSFQERVSNAVDKAGKEGRELGDSIGDVLSKDLPKLFEGGADLFRKQPATEPPTKL